MPEPFRYLAFKNWAKYQSGKKGWDWIKDYVNQNDDEELGKLSLFERGLLQELRRLRGRSGKNIPNNATHIAQAVHAIGTDRARIGNALHTLIEQNILVLTNQQDGFVEEKRGEEKRGDKSGAVGPSEETSKPEPKPDPFTAQDLAPTLLTQIGVGLSHGTANAAIQALKVKAAAPGWDVQRACLHIVERAEAYKSSEVFKRNGTRFKSWEKWLLEGCYDEPPESWQATGKKKPERGYVPYVPKKDKE